MAASSPKLASSTPSPLTTATCSGLGAHDGTRAFYQSLLPASVQRMVDVYIAADAWRFAGDFASISLASTSRVLFAKYTTLATGEDVVCMAASRLANSPHSTHTEIIRLDLRESDPRRVRILNDVGGEAFILVEMEEDDDDNKPYIIYDLNGTLSPYQLSQVTNSPITSRDGAWVICGDSTPLWLLTPRNVTLPQICITYHIWSEASLYLAPIVAQRLVVSSTSTDRRYILDIYDLRNQSLLFSIDEHVSSAWYLSPEWDCTFFKSAGVLVHSLHNGARLLDTTCDFASHITGSDRLLLRDNKQRHRIWDKHRPTELINVPEVALEPTIQGYSIYMYSLSGNDLLFINWATGLQSIWHCSCKVKSIEEIGFAALVQTYSNEFYIVPLTDPLPSLAAAGLVTAIPLPAKPRRVSGAQSYKSRAQRACASDTPRLFLFPFGGPLIMQVIPKPINY